MAEPKLKSDERWKLDPPDDDEIAALPRRVEFVDAARCLRIGRERAYQLAKAGRFPINLARDGRRYFASRTELLQELDHPGSVRPELCDDEEGAA